MSALILVGAAGIVAWLGTAATLRCAVPLGLVQMPNHRSSHVRPTPHSGGMGILLGGTLAGIWVAQWKPMEGWVILGLALVLALVGLRDDFKHLPARVRFAVQAAVCGLLLAVSGPLPAIELPAQAYIGGAAVIGMMLFAGLWWINLFNFMDGIDGIAGSQAVFMLVAGAMLGASFHPEVMGAAVWLWMLAAAAATVGFLIFNWPPARIFMGDVGSTYLAFMIFALGLLSVRDGWLTYPAWLVLGAVFISDATTTLLRRILAAERWFEAHRSHAYQRLSRRWGAHRPVTLLAIGVNVLWLMPLAWAILKWSQWTWGFVVAAYFPLVVGVLLQGAGKQDNA